MEVVDRYSHFWISTIEIDSYLKDYPGNALDNPCFSQQNR